jgi:hypothetical protein
MEVKHIRVKELSNLQLCTKFRISTLSRLGEMRIGSCQKVSALPADKPSTRCGELFHLENVQQIIHALRCSTKNIAKSILVEKFTLY